MRVTLLENIGGCILLRINFTCKNTAFNHSLQKKKIRNRTRLFQTVLLRLNISM